MVKIGICLLMISLSAYAGDSMVRVSCEGDSLGAEVSINGKFKGECPLDIQIPAGMLNITASKVVSPGKIRSFQQQIRLGDDVVKRIDIVLGPVEWTPEGKRMEEERLRKETLALEQKKAEEERQIAAMYTILGDGSEVLDRETNLIWKRCYEGEVWNGTTCSGNRLIDDLSNMLLKYNTPANTPQSWRVPSIYELVSLRKCPDVDVAKASQVTLPQKKVVSHCAGALTLPQKIFPGDKKLFIWSSTPVEEAFSELIPKAHMVKFDTGVIYHQMFNLKGQVLDSGAFRLVRNP